MASVFNGIGTIGTTAKAIVNGKSYKPGSTVRGTQGNDFLSLWSLNGNGGFRYPNGTTLSLLGGDGNDRIRINNKIGDNLTVVYASGGSGKDTLELAGKSSDWQKLSGYGASSLPAYRSKATGAVVLYSGFQSVNFLG